MVIVGHMACEHLAPDFLRAYAGLGVRVFFVLSGYLITTILLKERDRTCSINLRNFYVRRAYRIFPAALFYMLCIFIVYWHSLRWYEIAMALSYVVNYFPRPWVIGHLWSLSVEEQFYFLWPGILKKWCRYRLIVLISVLVFSPVYTSALLYLKWFQGVGPETFPSVADGLAVGCLLAMSSIRWPRISKFLFPVLAAIVLAIPLVGATSVPRTLFLLFVLNPVLDAAIAGIVIHVVQNPYRVLNFAPVVWLGQISYSLYLWQQPFVNPASPTRYGIIPAVALACASYYLIERPLLRVRDGRSSSTSTDSRAEAVAA